MSITLSRSNAILIAMLVTALLAGLLVISTASAQDAPVDPPTANGGIMTGAADHPLHTGDWMSDTVTAVPGRQMGTHDAMTVHPAGAAMRGSHPGAMNGYMIGGMTSRYMASGATGHMHNNAPSAYHQGAHQMEAGMGMQGAATEHAHGLPCTDCH
jgi:hypothetical protein